MPPSTRKRAAEADSSVTRDSPSTQTSKRPRTSGHGGGSKKKKTKGTEIVDLVDLEELPEDEPVAKVEESEEEEEVAEEPNAESKRIMFSKVRCPICMEPATNVTVTHCGHLFCAECLHESLHVDTLPKKCPLCRARIELKPHGNYTSLTKGFWHLQLKMMTKKDLKKKSLAPPPGISS